MDVGFYYYGFYNMMLTLIDINHQRFHQVT